MHGAFHPIDATIYNTYVKLDTLLRKLDTIEIELNIPQITAGVFRIKQEDLQEGWNNFLFKDVMRLFFHTGLTRIFFVHGYVVWLSLSTFKVNTLFEIL